LVNPAAAGKKIEPSAQRVMTGEDFLFNLHQPIIREKKPAKVSSDTISMKAVPWGAK